ncbi:MAG: aminodeoxychorismate lyase [Gammaproteobacteria bacterium]|nr:aminodeoxychorismate lyase [Gammaproteobacteria bacterium]
MACSPRWDWRDNGVVVVSQGVPVTDRGFQFGDGLFETLAVKQGMPRLWPAHRRRIEQGLRQLRLSLKQIDWPALEETMFAEAAAQGEGSLKLVVTAGDSARGYARTAGALRWVVIRGEVAARPAEWWRNGVQLHLCETRLGSNSALAGIKHLNRLEQVLARAEWNDQTIADGLMMDSHGHPVCCTMANLFVVNGNQVSTPGLATCGVRGVMRGQILMHAELLGMTATEEQIQLEQVITADEVFVTNSLIGLWPVCRIGDRPVSVGPVTQILLELVATDALVPG